MHKKSICGFLLELFSGFSGFPIFLLNGPICHCFADNKLNHQDIEQGLIKGEIIGEQVNVARDLGNIPGGEMTPKLLAAKAQQAGRENKFKVTILDVAAMTKLKMGAIFC